MANQKDIVAPQGSDVGQTSPASEGVSKGKRVLCSLGAATVKVKRTVNGASTVITGKRVFCSWVDPDIANLLGFKALTAAERADVLKENPDLDVSLRGSRNGKTIIITHPTLKTPKGKPKTFQFNVDVSLTTKTLGAMFGKFMPTTITSARIKGGYGFPITR